MIHYGIVMHLSPVLYHIATSVQLPINIFNHAELIVDLTNGQYVKIRKGQVGSSADPVLVELFTSIQLVDFIPIQLTDISI